MNRRKSPCFEQPVTGRAQSASPPFAARVWTRPLLGDPGRVPPRAQRDGSSPLNHFVDGACELSICDLERGNRAVIQVRGEIDLSNRDVLERALERALTGTQPEIALDLSELDFVDAHTVGSWHKAASSLRMQSRNLVLLNPAPLVAELVELIGVDCAIEYTRPGGDFARR